MADNTVQIKITGDASGFAPASKTVKRDLDSIGTSTVSVRGAVEQLKGALAGLAGAAALTALVKSSLDAALQMERLQKMMTAATGSAALAAKELEYVRSTATRLGLDLATTADSYGKFLAAIRGTTLEGERGRKVFESVSGAASALGLSAADTSGVFNALQQMMSKGKVQAEELRGQLGERLPGAFKLAADAMGMTTAELDKALQSGKVMAEDLLPKLADQLDKKFGGAALSAQNQLNLMNNAIFEAKAALGAALIPAFTDAVKAMAPALELLKEFVGGLQIIAIKAAHAWDNMTGNYSMDEKRRTMQAREEAIADLMKRYTPQAADYSAAEAAKQALNIRQALAGGDKPKSTTKDTLAAELRAHEKYLDDLRRAQGEYHKYKLALLDAEVAANDNARALELAKLDSLRGQDLISEAAYLAQKNGINNSAADEKVNYLKRKLSEAIDVERNALLELNADMTGTTAQVSEYHRSIIDQVNIRKQLEKATNEQAITGVRGQLAIQQQITSEVEKLKDLQNATTDINISMAAGSDPAAQQMAQIEERYRREKELIQDKLTALEQANLTETAMYQALSENIIAMAAKREQDIVNIQRRQSEEGWQAVVGAAQKAFPKLTGLDKAVTAAFKDHTKYRLATEQERAAGAQKLVKDETRSNLSMYSSYAGAAGAVFEGLAATQDTTSRAGFETAKAFNIAAAVMNTAMAITNALATVQPYPAAVAAAVMAGAMGAMQIATIASTSFGGTAAAPSVPSAGTFSGGSAMFGGAVGGSIGNQYTSVGESQDQASLQRIADSMENASLALGRVADGLTKVEDLFGDDTFMSKALESIAYASTTFSYISDKNRSIMHTAQLDMTAGDVATRVMEYFESKQSDGWRNYAQTWTAGGGFEALVQQSLDRVASQIMRGAAVMSSTANLTAADIDKREIKLVGRKPEDIAADLEDWFADASGAMAMTIEGLIDFTFYGENAFDALMRLSTALQSTNEAFELIGATLIDDTMAGGNAAYKLQQLMGGTEAFAESIDTYFTTMFSEAEQDAAKAAQAERQVRTAFNEIATVMTVSMPNTREEFRNLVNSLDLTDESAASVFAALMNVSESFGTVMDAADEAAAKLQEISSAMQDLDVRYLQATGQGDAADALSRQLSAQREIEAAIADNMGDAYIARLRDVLRLEEQAVNESAAAAALSDATTALKNSFAAEKAALTTAYNTELDRLNTNLDAAKTVVSDLTGYVNKLRSASDRMQLQDAAYQRSQYAAAQAMLAATLVAARGGDLSALRDMDASLEILTNQGQDAYANSTDYQRDFWQTKNSILELEQLAGNQLTDAERAVALAQDQISLLKTQHDAQLAAMDAQLNALQGINTSVLSLADAIASYQAASAAATAIKAVSATPAVTDPIANLYQTILGRAPEAEGYVYWTSQMAAGVALADIAASFYDSPEYKALNSYAVGTSFVPYDMTANIHQGEIIIDRQSADVLRRYGIPANGSADNAALVEEVRMLRTELRAAQYEIAKNTQKTARLMDRWDGDGMPEVRAA